MNSILQKPTPNLKASLTFYKQLNFKILSKKEKSTLGFEKTAGNLEHVSFLKNIEII